MCVLFIFPVIASALVTSHSSTTLYLTMGNCTGKAKGNGILFMKAASVAFVYFRVTVVFIMALGTEPGALGTVHKPTSKKLQLQPKKQHSLKLLVGNNCVVFPEC